MSQPTPPSSSTSVDPFGGTMPERLDGATGRDYHRLVAEHVRDLISLHRGDGACIFVSPTSRTMLGREPADMIGVPLKEFIHPADHTQARVALQAHQTPGHHSILVHRLRRADGSYVWAESISETRRDPDDADSIRIVTTTRDISKRKEAEFGLVAAHDLLNSVYEAIPVGICVIDEASHIRQCNGAFAALLGTTPGKLVERPASDFIPTGDLLRARAAPGSPNEADLRNLAGETIPVELTCSTLPASGPNHLLIAVSDLRARKRIETRLREARQLESLGTLAGGIAHDFNNLLAIILGYASLLRDASGDPERLGHYANTIIDAGRRGSEVVRQLQLFANQHDAELAPTDLHAFLDAAISRYTSNWPESVRVLRDYTAAQPLITLDTQQLALGLQHVLQNALEAMPQGGILLLRTADVVRPTTLGGGPTGDATHFVCITIEDTGRGMDAATQARMFEPFFARNKGPETRGIGMAVVYGIMRAHRGLIEVDSEPGRGTRVHLLLQRGSGEPTTAEAAPSSATLNGGHLVLLVEDENDIGRLWLELFATYQIPVLWARDGEEALDLFRQHREDIALLFSDIGLPGIDGWQVVARVRAERPELPLVLASGAFKDGDRQREGLSDPVAFVPKPYDPFKVIDRLRAHLPT